VRRILKTKEWLGLLQDPLQVRVGEGERGGGGGGGGVVGRGGGGGCDDNGDNGGDRRSLADFSFPLLPLLLILILLLLLLLLLQDAVLGPTSTDLYQSVGCEEDKLIALEMARESIVLVQNKDDLLPLSTTTTTTTTTTTRVLVTGWGCDSLSHQSGGWTYHWQGAQDDEFVYGTTIRQELEGALGVESVVYVEGGREGVVVAGNGSVDVVVVCIGEGPYAEKPGDINDPNLPSSQVDYVKELSSTTTPVVLVVVEGRPRLLQGIPEMVEAVVVAMVPGPAAGRAIVDVLLGATNPSGRMPFTYPKYTGTMLTQYHSKVSGGGGGGSSSCCCCCCNSSGTRSSR